MNVYVNQASSLDLLVLKQHISYIRHRHSILSLYAADDSPPEVTIDQLI